MATRGQEERVAQALAELWDQHRGDALARVGVLEDAAAALAAGELGPETREEARAAAHKLRGSAGTYGFPRAGELAGELEDLLAAKGAIPQDRVPELASSVLALRAELEGEPRPGWAGSRESERALDLLVVSEDPELGERLIAAATERRLRAKLVTVDEARERLDRDSPEIILVDLAGRGDGDLDFVGELVHGERRVPLLALAGSGTLVDRVQAARHGAHGFLDRTRHPDMLIDAAQRFAAGLRASPTTVLAVDDDPSALAAVRALLGARGYRVETAENAEQFWARLDEVSPDLAIVDLDMPHVNGFELCRALRGDPRWSGLPLLILTAYRDHEVVRQAFAAGADDYVPKPIVEEELAGRIRNRLDRVRAYREARGRDDLTGVLSRSAVIAELERITRHAVDADEPLSLALIDVDGLRGVNESHGLAAGDALLRRVGEALLRELDSETVGRWDGDQFIVGLNGMNPADATRWLSGVLERLRGEDLGASLSAGVAGAEGRTIDPVAIISAAERALAEAARAGGGQLVAAPQPGELERVDVAIVEDDLMVVEVLELAIRTLGLTTSTFLDGVQASAALAGEPRTLLARVVLLDWDLPGLDGLSVLRRMADTGVLWNTRVIMLTARASEQETVKALGFGATDFVAKPFSVPVLVERVRRALEQ